MNPSSAFMSLNQDDWSVRCCLGSVPIEDVQPPIDLLLFIIGNQFASWVWKRKGKFTKPHVTFSTFHGYTSRMQIRTPCPSPPLQPPPGTPADASRLKSIELGCWLTIIFPLVACKIQHLVSTSTRNWSCWHHWCEPDPIGPFSPKKTEWKWPKIGQWVPSITANSFRK